MTGSGHGLPRRRSGLLSIRGAAAGDAEAIAGLHCRAALVGYADIFPINAPKPTSDTLRSGWERLLADPAATVLVAEAEPGPEANGRPIGVAAIALDETVPSGLLLRRLYVDPDWWGIGAGSELHDRVIDRARARGAAAIDLWVLEANHRARSMYERRSWRLVPDRFLHGSDPSVVEVLYQRSI